MALSPEGYPWDPDMQLSKQRAVEAYLAGKKNDLLSLGIDVDYRASTGSVCDEICRFAESDPASVIVMSTHGRSGIRRFLLGSVAEKVMQRARVPLMVVRSNVDGHEGPPQGEHDFRVSRATKTLCDLRFYSNYGRIIN
jgi:nucleotide-binding universal stress UspA family protein